MEEKDLLDELDSKGIFHFIGALSQIIKASKEAGKSSIEIKKIELAVERAKQFQDKHPNI